MKTPIKLLNQEDFRVLKVIKIGGDEKKLFNAYLIYKRFLTPNYTATNTDLLDDLIFKAVSKIHPNLFIELSKDILFEGEYEDLMKLYQTGTSINLTIRFTPKFPFDRLHEFLGREFYEYKPKFKFNISFWRKSDKLNNISDFTYIDFPFEAIDHFSELIGTIDFNY